MIQVGWPMPLPISSASATWHFHNASNQRHTLHGSNMAIHNASEGAANKGESYFLLLVRKHSAMMGFTGQDQDDKDSKFVHPVKETSINTTPLHS
ncbi:hypothetical protein Nepgr_008025 [Nepenthes gracilis]|uniref:Uncharacterized protein n=1 Tax=Nepenthes gracilis TaxID=150966 RepID=A0AAD3S814_NEPGR|nr:hypothetical protein Nepgr_008025 [Nepenthes gracilis]